ncbi:MAG TPA: hypothetical protein VGB99_13810 [Acidobacteriota bacterium]
MVLLTIVAPCQAQAAIVQYDSRTAWEAAVPGGGNLSDNFSTYEADNVFRPGRVLTGAGIGAIGIGASRVRHHFVALNHADFSMGTMTAMGYDWNYNNLIDALPIQDPNSVFTTAHVPIFINAAEANRPATTVRIDFSSPVRSWGALFNGARSGERLAIDVLGAGDVLLGTLLVASNNTFLGFVGTVNEQVRALVFRSQLLIVGANGEAFLMDDAVGYRP